MELKFGYMYDVTSTCHSCITMTNIYKQRRLLYSQIIIQKIYNGRVELWWCNESLILWKRYDKIRDRHPFHRTARGQSFLSNASSNIWQRRRQHKQQIVFLYYVYTTTNDLWCNLTFFFKCIQYVDIIGEVIDIF